jgi:hypothetical protein
MRLIRWFRSAWADAGKSGEWMADSPAFREPPLSRWARWNIRTLPRNDMLFSLLITALLVLVTIVLLVVVLADAFL